MRPRGMYAPLLVNARVGGTQRVRPGRTRAWLAMVPRARPCVQDARMCHLARHSSARRFASSHPSPPGSPHARRPCVPDARITDHSHATLTL